VERLEDMSVPTLLETHREKGTEGNNKRNYDRWENLLDGSWIHPKLGIVRKVAACHKFKFDWFAYPEELNLKNKLGPFLNRTEAIKALEEYKEKRISQHEPDMSKLP
jgi:hypothetical protein